MVNSTRSFIVTHSKEQHYSTFFNPATGFFARVEDPGYQEPFWAWNGPELLDIAITTWCDRECDFCYRKADRGGHHLSLKHYEIIMKQAQYMHVSQVALGGGNPNQHPSFCEILSMTRKKYGIVPNYTTNGRGLTSDVLNATHKYCGAVAVSAYHPYNDLCDALKLLSSYGIRTNIHYILTATSVDTAISWLEDAPNFLHTANAIIFLNYKPIGRNVDDGLLLKHSEKTQYFFQLATKRRYPFKIGFDSCSITGIANFTNIPIVCYEGCDAGRFSMFISENMEMYPCSFMAETGYNGIPVSEDNIQSSWQNSILFKDFREKLSIDHCRSCQMSKVCLGGCIVFPEINLCPDLVERSNGLSFMKNVD